MSCGLQRPISGHKKSWEANPVLANNYWAHRNRTDGFNILPCRWPNYYYSPNAPTSYSYRWTQPYNLGQDVPNDFWKDPSHYYRFPQYGANLLFNEPAVGSYVLTRGACITGSGCYDNTTSNSCLYHPFVAGATCKEVGRMQDLLKRDLSQGTEPRGPEDYAPWAGLNATWHDLMNDWRYERPAYNQ